MLCKEHASACAPPNTLTSLASTLVVLRRLLAHVQVNCAGEGGKRGATTEHGLGAGVAGENCSREESSPDSVVDVVLCAVLGTSVVIPVRRRAAAMCDEDGPAGVGPHLLMYAKDEVGSQLEQTDHTLPLHGQRQH